MEKKVRIIHLIGLVLPVLIAAQSAWADAAADLKWAEGLYKAGKYAEAEQLCRKVLDGQPSDHEIVCQAGKILPQVYLATDRPTEAQEAVQQLLTRSAGHEYLPHALHETIEQAKTLGKTAEVGRICRDLLSAGPQPSQGVWLKMGIALADVYLGNDQAVASGVSDIVAHDAGDPGAAEALAQIGWAYDKLGRHGKARLLYEHVVDNWSEKPRAIYAHTALIRDCIRLNDEPAAQTRLEQLVERYSKDTHLSNVLNEIARGYREVRMYEEAKPISQYILDNYRGNDQCLWAERDIILCDIALRHPQDARNTVRRLAQGYAKDGHLPYVLNEIAQTFREAGMYEQARPVSQYILDNYPVNDQRLWAQRDIILCDIGQGRPDAAQTGVQTLVKDDPNNGYLPYVLREIAGEYRRERMYSQAKSVSQYILDNYSESDQCLWAQRDIVLSDLALKDLDAARAGAETLLTRCVGQSGALWAVSEVAQMYAMLGQHDRARELYRFNLTNSPNADDTIWSLRGFIDESIALQDDAAIHAGITRLFSEYASSKNLPMAAVHIGRELCKAGHPRASELLQYVLDKHPDDEQALQARICMGHVYLMQGQDGQTEDLYREILAEYAGHPGLAQAVQLMGEGYFDRAVALERENARQMGTPEYARMVREQGRPDVVKGYYRQAIEKWELVIQKLPLAASDAPRMYHFTGTGYRLLGQPEKALEYYQEVCDEWPDYTYAWHLQFVVAQIYKDMVGSGSIPESEADPEIQAALTAVIQRYPNCPAAKAADNWLGLIARLQEGEHR